MKTPFQALACVVLILGCASVGFSQEASGARVDFQDFLHATLSPSTIVQPAVGTTWSQYVTQPAGFGSGPDAYGYRYGVSLINNVDGKFVRKFVFPVLFGERDLYQPSGTGTVLARASHAAWHSIFTETSGGTERINMSGLPASIFLATLANSYEPRPQRTLRANMLRMGANSAGYFATDVIREFGVVCKVRKLLRAGCR